MLIKINFEKLLKNLHINSWSWLEFLIMANNDKKPFTTLKRFSFSTSTDNINQVVMFLVQKTAPQRDIAVNTAFF